MILFRRQRLRPGLIFSVTGANLTSMLISKVLSKGFDKLGPEAKKIVPVCPCHDGLTVEVNDIMYIGESKPYKARLTPLDTYEADFESGAAFNPRIFEVVGATEEEERKAVDYWLNDVDGTWYDFLAFPRLFIKAVLIDKFDYPAGWEWAHWCTEGVAEAFENALGRNIYGKTNPTPLTTIKRVLDGVLRDVTSDMMVILNPPDTPQKEWKKHTSSNLVLRT